MFAIISTFSKTFDEVGLIYFVPAFLKEQLKLGMIVEVTLREKIEIWVVLKFWTQEELWLNIDESKIKSLVWIKNEKIFLKKYRLELLIWIAGHYFTPIHNSTGLFFPKNLREKIVKGKVPLSQSFPQGEKEVATKERYNFNHKKELSESQKKAYLSIKSSQNNKILLHGITWSWKTEIYIKLIKDNLDKGKQSLLLIPEIILTNQLATRLKDVFWEDIIVLNSSVSEAKKTNYWLDIDSGKAKIILWTRSSIFYPYNNIWLIIIDEEHDNSYISDSSPRYNSIEVAEKITKLNWNMLLLGSWSPSVKSMYKALKGEYSLVSLFKKFDN